MPLGTAFILVAFRQWTRDQGDLLHL